jgi:hypothetical protein
LVSLSVTAVGVALLILFVHRPFKPAQANAGVRK